MTEIHYIKILLQNPRRDQIILDPKGKVKQFASKNSCERWLNKNKEDLTPGAIYTPVIGLII